MTRSSRTILGLGLATLVLLGSAQESFAIFGWFRNPCWSDPCSTCRTTYRPLFPRLTYYRGAGCSTCNSCNACGCSPCSCNYAPTSCCMPVTTYRPIVSCDPCGGTVMRPVTGYVAPSYSSDYVPLSVPTGGSSGCSSCSASTAYPSGAYRSSVIDRAIDNMNGGEPQTYARSTPVYRAPSTRTYADRSTVVSRDLPSRRTVTRVDDVAPSNSSSIYSDEVLGNRSSKVDSLAQDSQYFPPNRTTTKRSLTKRVPAEESTASREADVTELSQPPIPDFKRSGPTRKLESREGDDDRTTRLPTYRTASDRVVRDADVRPTQHTQKSKKKLDDSGWYPVRDR